MWSGGRRALVVVALAWSLGEAVAGVHVVNLSHRAGEQTETAIAVNPRDPAQLFAFANDNDAALGMFAAHSFDGGQTWQYVRPNGLLADGTDGLPGAFCDPSLAYDSYGNLFVCYLDRAATAVTVVSSTNNGVTFATRARLPFKASGRALTRGRHAVPLVGGRTLSTPGDQPTVATGPGCVWVTYADDAGNISAQGAAVTGLGQVGAFGPEQTAPGSAGCSFGDLKIGPQGEVADLFQDTRTGAGTAAISLSLDADGLGGNGFGQPRLVTMTNVGGYCPIPAQPNRSIDAECGLTWDQTGGPHNDRLVVIYTDRANTTTADTDIFTRYSDDRGATWSAPRRVNDDSTQRSQFFPKLALDPTTGNLAACWYDCRQSSTNTDAMVYAAVSTDGGATWQANQPISGGASNALRTGNPNEFADYIGLAAYGGQFFPCWTDDSNSTGDNPDGVQHMDIYAAVVPFAQTAQELNLPGVQTTERDQPVSLAPPVSVTEPSPDSTTVKLTLFATNGTVACGTTTGLTFAPGHTLPGANPVFTGSATNVNAALAGLTFTPTSLFGGLALLQVTLESAGGRRTGTVRIWVNSRGGKVTAWGDSTYAQTSVPADLTTALAVAAGQNHTLALLADQTVVAWGSNASGQRAVPAGLNGVAAVAAGYAHSLALLTNGTVRAWGSNSSGQCTVPANATDVVAIAAGWAHSAALKADGTVVCWGNTKYGQCAVPATLGIAAALGAGGYHTLAVRQDGTVLGWGQNAAQQATGGAQVTGALAVTGSAAASAALKSNGALASWGTGLGAPGGSFTAVSALDAHAVGLKADHTVVCFGGNTKGEGTAPSLVAVVSVAAGQYHSAAVSLFNEPPVVTVPPTQTSQGGAPVVLGIFNHISLEDPDAADSLEEVTLFATHGTVKLTGNSPVTFAPGHGDGTANPVLRGTLDQLFLALLGLTFTPTPGFGGLALLQVTLNDLGANGPGGALQATRTLPIWVTSPGGSVQAWGDNTYGQCRPPAGLTNAVALAAGQYHTLALRADQTVVAWGSNASGQRAVPAGLTGVVALAAGYAHSLALRADGTVVAWGSNSSGQCNVPAGLTGVVAIAAGWAHSAALLGDGRVVCWGNNRYGQGVTPASPGTLAALGAGAYHTLAVRNDGTVVGWGQNTSHQVDGAGTQAGALAVTGGTSASLALRGDGTLASWGSGLSAPGGGFKAVAALAGHAVGQSAGGTVVCFGSNAAGESTPPPLTQVLAVAAGQSHSAAIVAPSKSAAATVALVVSPGSPTPVGTRLTLTATLAQPVAGAEYQFLGSSDGGRTLVLLRDWGGANTTDWTPTIAGAYTLYVNVRGGASGRASAAAVVSAS